MFVRIWYDVDGPQPGEWIDLTEDPEIKMEDVEESPPEVPAADSGVECFCRDEAVVSPKFILACGHFGHFCCLARWGGINPTCPS